jgi:hypothetical protein
MPGPIPVNPDDCIEYKLARVARVVVQTPYALVSIPRNPCAPRWKNIADLFCILLVISVGNIVAGKLV